MLQEYASLLQMKDFSKVFVVSRKLRIGLHNGNTVLGGDWQTYPLQEDSGDHDVLFTPPKTDITVEGYVPDSFMALAFLVEYELGIPAPRHTHFNSQLMMRSTTWADGRLVTAFTVCSSVYIPFNGSRLLLKNTATSAGSDEGVDIELQLLKDEACTLLSARPLILVKTNAGSDEAQEKGHTSLRAGDKDTDTSRAKVSLLLLIVNYQRIDSYYPACVLFALIRCWRKRTRGFPCWASTCGCSILCWEKCSTTRTWPNTPCWT